MIAGYHAADFSAGAIAGTLNILRAITFLVDGMAYQSPLANGMQMTVCVQQAVSTVCLYLISADGQGNITVTKGNDAAQASDALMPALPQGQGALGVLMVQTDGVTAFTSGVTDLTAPGITATFLDAPDQFRQHSSVVRISGAHLSGRPLIVKERNFMERNIPLWLNTPAGVPVMVVRNFDRNIFRIWPKPQNPVTVMLTVYRRPLIELDVNAADQQSPEIPDEYHRRMLNGIAWRATLRTDTEVPAGSAASFNQLYKQDIEEINRSENRANYRDGAADVSASATT